MRRGPLPVRSRTRGFPSAPWRRTRAPVQIRIRPAATPSSGPCCLPRLNRSGSRGGRGARVETRWVRSGTAEAPGRCLRAEPEGAGPGAPGPGRRGGRAASSAPWRWRPTTASYHFNLARAAARARTVRIAPWPQYREVARLQPNDYAARYGAGRWRCRRRATTRRRSPSSEARSRSTPTIPNAHLALGVSLERVGRVSDAVPRIPAISCDSAERPPTPQRLKAHLASSRRRGLR